MSRGYCDVNRVRWDSWTYSGVGFGGPSTSRMVLSSASAVVNGVDSNANAAEPCSRGPYKPTPQPAIVARSQDSESSASVINSVWPSRLARVRTYHPSG